MVASLAPAYERALAEDQAQYLSPAALFDTAQRAEERGEFALAFALYGSLAGHPNIAIRSEARFRHAALLRRLNRLAEAATLYRAIIDEQPDAQPVRLELAAVLAQMGDIAAARRALRQAQAGGLPPDVALMVQQFAAALRSRKPWGGSFELALAPDSNINRATSATTLDTVIAPLTLSQDARARSGLGLKESSQVYARFDLGRRVTLVSRLSSQATLYRASAFNDVSGSALLGLEWRLGGDRLTPSAGATWRWYGGPLYARTQSLSLDWLHPLGRRAQLDSGASVNRVRYRANGLQDGLIYTASLGYERALSARAGFSLSLAANRQTARDPGYATASGTLGATLWREGGKTTLFASATASRLEADARLGLFAQRRRDGFWRVGAGAVFRQITVAGFSPVVRVAYERNASSVGIYDFRRVSTDLGITRAF